MRASNKTENAPYRHILSLYLLHGTQYIAIVFNIEWDNILSLIADVDPIDRPKSVSYITRTRCTRIRAHTGKSMDLEANGHASHK